MVKEQQKEDYVQIQVYVYHGEAIYWPLNEPQQRYFYDSKLIFQIQRYGIIAHYFKDINITL